MEVESIRGGGKSRDPLDGRGTSSTGSRVALLSPCPVATALRGSRRFSSSGESRNLVLRRRRELFSSSLRTRRRKLTTSKLEGSRTARPRRIEDGADNLNPGLEWRSKSWQPGREGTEANERERRPPAALAESRPTKESFEGRMIERRKTLSNC